MRPSCSPVITRVAAEAVVGGVVVTANQNCVFLNVCIKELSFVRTDNYSLSIALNLISHSNMFPANLVQATFQQVSEAFIYEYIFKVRHIWLTRQG